MTNDLPRGKAAVAAVPRRSSACGAVVLILLHLRDLV